MQNTDANVIFPTMLSVEIINGSTSAGLPEVKVAELHLDACRDGSSFQPTLCLLFCMICFIFEKYCSFHLMLRMPANNKIACL